MLEDVGENLAEAPAVEDEVVAGPGEQDAVAAGPGDDQPEQRGAGEVQAGGAVGGQYLAQPFVPVGLGQRTQVVMGDGDRGPAVDDLQWLVSIVPGHAGAQGGGAVGDVLPGLAEGGGVGDAVEQELGLAEVQV